MKKTYQKPKISIERFVLSQTIAQSCGYVSGNSSGKPTHANKNTCGWDDGYGDVYWLSADTCTEIVSEDFTNGEYCYNNPNGGVSIFAS